VSGGSKAKRKLLWRLRTSRIKGLDKRGPTCNAWVSNRKRAMTIDRERFDSLRQDSFRRELLLLGKPDPEAAYVQGAKDGAVAAIQAIVSTLEENWKTRLWMRIMPLSILRKVAERLPARLDQLQLG